MEREVKGSESCTPSSRPSTGTKLNAVAGKVVDELGSAASAILVPGGTWMLVEPHAGDRVEESLKPVGRPFYAASTLVRVPNALAAHGLALGAPAREARLRDVALQVGFSSFRRATETPFNVVLEAR